MDITPYKVPQGIFTPVFADGYFRAVATTGVKNSRKIAPLGNITKLSAYFSEKNVYNEVLARVERFSLQNISSEILPNKRVSHCLKLRITKEKGVTVFYNEKRQKAQYGNLQTCGSVWDCPVCASRITEGRRLELKQGMDRWKDTQGAVYLVTFTNRHHVGDNLKDLLEGQKEAFKKFYKIGNMWRLLNKLGYTGKITATEVTYGRNGWHPHYHILMFFEGEINQQSLKSLLATNWQKACVKAGLKKPTIKNGVDVQDGSYADKYVSKWGLDYEMTKGHTKKGRDDAYTPFDLLKMSVDDVKYRKLFKEYSEAFYRKQQLHWSKGLKALLEVDTKTDEELASETDNEAVKVNELALQLWQLIRKAKKRAEYLHAVELDYLDNGTRADDLVMGLAKNHIAELLANADDLDTPSIDNIYT